MHTLGLFGNIGHWELLIVLAIGLLVFGRRLPEVGRSLGKGIVEFKRGLKDIEDDIDHESSKPKQISEPSKGPSLKPPTTPSGEDARVKQAEPVAHPEQGAPGQ